MRWAKVGEATAASREHRRLHCAICERPLVPGEGGRLRCVDHHADLAQGAQGIASGGSITTPATQANGLTVRTIFRLGPEFEIPAGSKITLSWPAEDDPFEGHGRPMVDEEELDPRNDPAKPLALKGWCFRCEKDIAPGHRWGTDPCPHCGRDPEEPSPVACLPDLDETDSCGRQAEEFRQRVHADQRQGGAS